MGIHIFARTPPLSLPPSLTSIKNKGQYPIHSPTLAKNQSHLSRLAPFSATLNSPKGFGPSPNKAKKSKKPRKDYESEEEEEEEEEAYDREEGVIPEIVTNRMMSRMAFSVGIPLFIGLLFFPFFYFLKVGLKIDVPTWVPFIVSFVFFGTSLLGVSYGIVSAPVFWQSIWGAGSKKK